MFRKILIVSFLCLPLLSFTKKKTKHTPGQQATADCMDYRQLKAPLPDVRVLQTNGEMITNRTVRNNANLFVMLFNPMCEHCEDMTAALIKDISLFRKSKIVMVAGSNMQPYMDGFRKQFKMEKYPTLMIGIDSSKLLDRLFNYTMLPQINIYDRNRKLIRTFNALEAVDSLKPYIE